jgi:hypothetical protein
MIQLKQWYFSVEEEENTSLSDTTVFKTFEEYPKTEIEFEQINEVIFSVDIDEVDEIEELPLFLKKLPNLKTVGLPIDWLDKIDIPENLSELHLFNQVFSYENKEQWPIGLKLNHLRHLSIPELVKPYEINISDFTTLKSIEYDFVAEKDNTKLLEIAKLPNLEKVIINQAKNMDVFSPFENTKINNLELFACTGKKVPIEFVTKLKKQRNCELIIYL